MPKEFTQGLVLAVAVFLGIYAYEKYTVYRAQVIMEKALGEYQHSIQQATAKSQQRSAELKLQTEARKQEKLRAEFDKTTACAINEDTNVCKCLNMKTGAVVKVLDDDCRTRARQITW